jgi:hypothetical protein
MKKTVRLTERDLTRIVKRVIKEGSENIEDLRHERLDLLKRIKRFANKSYNLENTVDIDLENTVDMDDDDMYGVGECVETADELLKALKRIGEDHDINDFE